MFADSFPGTVADQAKKMRERFGLERAVLVGDRGCITQAQINVLKEYPGLGWIGAGALADGPARAVPAPMARMSRGCRYFMWLS